GMLSPSTLLDLVRNFIVFEKSKKEDAKTGITQIETVKKLAAYHQYYAVNRAIESTLRASGFQPSTPALLPRGEGSHYRGGMDFTGLLKEARELRQNQTKAEEMFWQLVRNRKFANLKFRRQHQIGHYIADFFCNEHNLVIEFDGKVHDTEKQK